MKIVSNRYGKRRVRVLKVLRNGPRHEVKELDVGCMLEGDFDPSYSRADNSQVIPTDTVKNTVIGLAHRLLGPETEAFGLELGRHFLRAYPQVRRVEIDLRERRWERHSIAGEPHDHAFRLASGTPLARVACERGREAVRSGIDDLLILKSTGSAFSGFPRCEWTTLPETDDRILATSVRAEWDFDPAPAAFAEANAAILDAMIDFFATRPSPSVQATMHGMAQAAFAARTEVARLSLALPNKHYLLANLKPFGLENPNLTFVPTDEPHGQIEAVFSR